jgi:hypothetical protein
MNKSKRAVGQWQETAFTLNLLSRWTINVDRCGEFFPKEVLDGLVADVGVTAYAVLAVLAAAATRETPVSKLSLEDIAELVGKSTHATRDAIDVLKKRGVVAVELEGRNNRYRILGAPGHTPTWRGKPTG